MGETETPTVTWVKLLAWLGIGALLVGLGALMITLWGTLLGRNDDAETFVTEMLVKPTAQKGEEGQVAEGAGREQWIAGNFVEPLNRALLCGVQVAAVVRVSHFMPAEQWMGGIVPPKHVQYVAGFVEAAEIAKLAE